MKISRTIKVRLITTTDQCSIFTATTRQFTDSFNRICKIGWEKRRINNVELHHETYQSERQQTNLPSQLVVAARVKAVESLTSARVLKRKGEKVSCPSSKFCPIRYDARTANIKLNQRCATLATISGRQQVGFKITPNQSRYLSWKIASSDLCRDRKGRWWLHIVVTRENAAPVPNGTVVGVDLGVNHPAVTSTNQFLGKHCWKNVEQKAFNLRRALQAKGSKSAKKHLRKMSGRLGRFRRDCDHVLSKQIVNSVKPGATIVLEDLTDIRSRMRGRRKQQRRLHSWSFARLQSFLTYKSIDAGVCIGYVSPRYTSQKCSKCGKRDRRSRKDQSHFRCTSCGFTLNADLNAARTIASNYLVRQATRLSDGPRVNWPIVVRPALPEVGTASPRL